LFASGVGDFDVGWGVFYELYHDRVAISSLASMDGGARCEGWAYHLESFVDFMHQHLPVLSKVCWIFSESSLVFLGVFGIAADIVSSE
jgi:hypothetical protein